jgi:dephospho-CoA kinase
LGYTGLMKVIALTGGIGSGKSTVAAYLKELGACVIDADKTGHEAMLPGTPAWQDILSTFGKSVVNPDQKINRAKLGKIVFGNREAITRLNNIIRPRIMELVINKLEVCRQKGFKISVLEIAELIVEDWEHIIDEIWVTVAPEGSRLKRLKSRSNYSEEESLLRMRSQKTDEERRKRADVIIDTDCTLHELKVKIKKLWDERLA